MTRLLCLLLLAGCATAPVSDAPYQAPTEYYPWWTEVVACAHVGGRFTELQWFTLDDAEPYVGYTVTPRIWIKEWAQNTRLVVEHEMLHALIGDGGHTDASWARCGLYPLSRDQIVGVVE